MLPDIDIELILKSIYYGFKTTEEALDKSQQIAEKIRNCIELLRPHPTLTDRIENQSEIVQENDRAPKSPSIPIVIGASSTQVTLVAPCRKILIPREIGADIASGFEFSVEQNRVRALPPSDATNWRQPDAARKISMDFTRFGDRYTIDALLRRSGDLRYLQIGIRRSSGFYQKEIMALLMGD